jgi:5-methyltetrahydropteroyltriglutamate--homocysteine methyltransferase
VGLIVATAQPPYRAEHVGSFPRPERLMKARELFAAGKLPRDALRELESECIRDVVALQERVGIGAITDGELRKVGWRDFVYEKTDGFTAERAPPSFKFTLYDGTIRQAGGSPGIAAKLRRREPYSADDFALLKPMTTHPIKANLPTPSSFHFQAGDRTIGKTAYEGRDALLADVAQIFRDEIADLARLGCTYLQLDEVPLAVICDPNNMEIVRKRGEDPDELIDDYIDAINEAIRDRPAGMAVAVHMCRGNVGHGMADGGYEPVAERMFNRLKVDGFFLEYDTKRSGDFAPLRFLPKGKIAVLGIVSTKLPELETGDALRRRIDEAARYAPLDQLALSPQCGFASGAATDRLPPGMVERKLARIVEVAQQVWG